jgi:hypothetical protein
VTRHHLLQDRRHQGFRRRETIQTCNKFGKHKRRKCSV